MQQDLALLNSYRKIRGLTDKPELLYWNLQHLIRQLVCYLSARISLKQKYLDTNHRSQDPPLFRWIPQRLLHTLLSRLRAPFYDICLSIHWKRVLQVEQAPIPIFQIVLELG